MPISITHKNSSSVTSIMLNYFSAKAFPLIVLDQFETKQSPYFDQPMHRSPMCNLCPEIFDEAQSLSGRNKHPGGKTRHSSPRRQSINHFIQQSMFISIPVVSSSHVITTFFHLLVVFALKKSLIDKRTTIFDLLSNVKLYFVQTTRSPFLWHSI